MSNKQIHTHTQYTNENEKKKIKSRDEIFIARTDNQSENSWCVLLFSCHIKIFAIF